MKTSTEISSIEKIVGKEKAVELVGKTGFDAWDLSMFDLVDENSPFFTDNAYGLVKRLRKIGEDNGIRCNQSHAPFPVNIQKIKDSLKKAIELTAIASGEICVIHPNNFHTPEQNAEMYLSLLPFAKEHSVKIGTENMWNWDDQRKIALPAACSNETDFLKHLNTVSDDYFVACLDIGHSEMAGLNTSAEKMILSLNDKLQALHIHDNDKIHDLHEIPFSMSIDFEKVVNALKQINYKGYLTLECNAYLSNRHYTEDNVSDGVKNMYLAVKKISDMF